MNSGHVDQGETGRRTLGRRARLTLLALGLVAIGGAAATAAVVNFGHKAGEIVRVRVGGGVDETRLVVEIDQSAAARIVSDPGELRHIAIALPRTHVGEGLQTEGPGAGRLRQWKVDDVAGAARLDLDFTSETVIKRRFLLPPDDGVTVWRYVIDFSAAPVTANRPARTDARIADKARAPAPAPAPARTQVAAVQPVLQAPQNSFATRKVVVIDAGHGGKDPGTSGAESVEKDLTLAAARDLKAALQRTGHYQVVLTRDNDVFIPLDQRIQTARRERADLFISLHVNSLADPTVHGASIYTLSEKGEDRVARREFSRGGDWLTNGDAPTHDPSVNRILLDLTQRQTTNQSSNFATILLDNLNGRVDLVRRSHRDANFAVLLASDVPAVLLEMGFITNPLDEQRLASAESRKEMAGAITQAIETYFTRPTHLAVR